MEPKNNKKNISENECWRLSRAMWGKAAATECRKNPINCFSMMKSSGSDAAVVLPIDMESVNWLLSHQRLARILWSIYRICSWVSRGNLYTCKDARWGKLIWTCFPKVIKDVTRAHVLTKQYLHRQSHLVRTVLGTASQWSIIFCSVGLSSGV